MYGLYKQEKVQGPVHTTSYIPAIPSALGIWSPDTHEWEKGRGTVIIQDWKYMSDAYYSFYAARRIGREKNDYLHASSLYSPRACSVVGW